jgi:magnesium transporter
LEEDDILWIDLRSPNEVEKKAIEQFLSINLQTPQQVAEIESSSRYFETETLITTNSNFLVQQNDSFGIEPVSFIVKDNILITLRNNDLKVFSETTKRIETNFRAYPTGFHIFVSIFEARIDLDADLIEAIAKDISYISKKMTVEKDLNENVLFSIAKFQESTMILRENIIDKQRVLSGILKSERFPIETFPKLKIMIKDIGSLLDYTAFGFERLEYLQDTFMGLINLEQNKIIKLFTVASVMFMPPTLVASMYGMNFKFMPEIEWKYGYVFGLCLIVMSSFLTYLFFKRRRWV